MSNYNEKIILVYLQTTENERPFIYWPSLYNKI